MTAGVAQDTDVLFSDFADKFDENFEVLRNAGVHAHTTLHMSSTRFSLEGCE